MGDREGQCPRSVSIYLPKAFRIALWARYRLWEDVRGVILGGLYQAWWNTVGGIVSTAAKGRGSNCGVWVWETNALGETTSWACDLHESSCLSASATSSGWTGALVGDTRFKTARQAGPSSHLTWKRRHSDRSEWCAQRRASGKWWSWDPNFGTPARSLSSLWPQCVASPERRDSVLIQSMNWWTDR